MTRCSDYRRGLLADPARPGSEMLAHAAQCQDCTRYTERVMRFEGRLERALQVDIGQLPGGRAAVYGAAGVRRSRRSRLRRRWVIAVSVLLTTGGAGLLWLAAPGRSLAAAVVDHMADEPDAWARSDVMVATPKLEAVMSGSGARLNPEVGMVTYVHSCELRGHQVPHLVLQTPAGPVTVMLLVHDAVRQSVHFNEQGYRGMIVPLARHGSLAVLEHAPDADPRILDEVVAQVVGALNWE